MRRSEERRVGKVTLERGGGLGEGGLKVYPDGRLADDGKRCSGDGRYSTIASRREEEIGEGSGEGRVKNQTGPEAGGFFFEVF